MRRQPLGIRAGGVDVHGRDVRPLHAQAGEPRFHDLHDSGCLGAHPLRRYIALADDAVTLGLATAGAAECRRCVRIFNGVAEAVHQRFARRVQHGRDVGAADRIDVALDDIPGFQDRAVAGVELVEAIGAHWHRAAQFHAAKRLFRPVRCGQLLLDSVEALAPGHRPAEDGVDDLVTGHRRRAGRKRVAGGQVNIAALRILNGFHTLAPHRSFVG